MLHFSHRTHRTGNLLLEGIVAIGVFAVFLGGVGMSLMIGETSTIAGGSRSTATFIAEGRLEAVRAMAKADFTQLTLNAGTHGLWFNPVSHAWEFAGTSYTTKEGFVSVVEITPINSSVLANCTTSDCLKVVSTVTWDFGQARAGSVTLRTYLTNWHKTANLGNWTNMTLVNVGHTAGPSDMQFGVVAAGNGLAFVGTNTGLMASLPPAYDGLFGRFHRFFSSLFAPYVSAATVGQVLVYDVKGNNAINPVLQSQIPFHYDITALAVQGTRLFVAGSNEVTIVDVRNPGAPQTLSHFTIPSGNILSLTYYTNSFYVGMTKEVHDNFFTKFIARVFAANSKEINGTSDEGVSSSSSSAFFLPSSSSSSMFVITSSSSSSLFTSSSPSSVSASSSVGSSVSSSISSSSSASVSIDPCNGSAASVGMSNKESASASPCSRSSVSSSVSSSSSASVSIDPCNGSAASVGMSNKESASASPCSRSSVSSSLSSDSSSSSNALSSSLTISSSSSSASFISSNGTTLVVGTDDGHLYFIRVGDDDSMVLRTASTLDLTAYGGGRVTKIGSQDGYLYIAVSGNTQAKLLTVDLVSDLDHPTVVGGANPLGIAEGTSVVPLAHHVLLGRTYDSQSIGNQLLLYAKNSLIGQSGTVTPVSAWDVVGSSAIVDLTATYDGTYAFGSNQSVIAVFDMAKFASNTPPVVKTFPSTGLVNSLTYDPSSNLLYAVDVKTTGLNPSTNFYIFKPQ